MEKEFSYDCDGDTQSGTVDASDWVRESSPIAKYRYESDVENDRIAITLLDTSNDELGVMTVQGFFGLEAGSTRHVEATFERNDSPTLELFSDAVISNDHQEEFRTRTLLTIDDAEVLIRADFKALECYANEAPDEGQGHPCAWPVPVFDTEYSVPTCGFDVMPGLPVAPNLTALEYRVSSDTDPAIGGFLWNSNESLATFDVVDHGGHVTDSAQLGEWLNATGANHIIGSESEQLLSAAYVDPAWMDEVEAHAAECVRQEFEEQFQTVRQPHSVSGLTCEQGVNLLSSMRTDDEVRTIFQPGGGGCGEDCADGCGKPHFRTFDGSSYAFHAAGEFILSTAEFGAPYEIQVRTEPAGSLSCRSDIPACQNITVITAIAAQIGPTRVAIYRDESSHLWIDGEAVERVSNADLTNLPDGAAIHQRGETSFKLFWPGGESIEIEVREHQLDLHGTLPITRFGQVAGLWGNYTNITRDDFKTRSGRIIEKPFTFDELYDDFVDSWRIDDSESLFDYSDGEDTSTFTIAELPEEQVSVEDLPDDARREASNACRGVTGHPDFNWCIFDVVCMCDDDLAHSTDHLGPHESITDTHPDAPITITGDICLNVPESFEHLPAGEATCPPGLDECISFVREQAAVELATDLIVNATAPGRYESSESLVEAVVPAGTEVNSYLLHLNEVAQRTGVLRGEVLFAHEILGIIGTDQELESSDTLFAIDGAQFSDESRGLNFDDEWFRILEGGTGLAVQINSESSVSELRVITAASQQ